MINDIIADTFRNYVEKSFENYREKNGKKRKKYSKKSESGREREIKKSVSLYILAYSIGM